MNRSLLLARILGLGGALEAGAGLLLLACPSELAWLLLRSPLEGAGPVVARLGGGGLLALGIACWCARGTSLTPAGLGVAWGFLAYNLVACVTLAVARPALSNGGLLALGASVLHGLLAAALVAALAGRSHSSERSAS